MKALELGDWIRREHLLLTGNKGSNVKIQDTQHGRNNFEVQGAVRRLSESGHAWNSGWGDDKR